MVDHGQQLGVGILARGNFGLHHNLEMGYFGVEGHEGVLHLGMLVAGAFLLVGLVGGHAGLRIWALSHHLKLWNIQFATHPTI